MAGHQSVISGTVRDPQRQPVMDARAYFVDGPVPLPDIAVLTDNKGKFSLTAPVPGTYHIGCTADGFASTTTAVSVKSGQDVQIEIELKR